MLPKKTDLFFATVVPDFFATVVPDFFATASFCDRLRTLISPVALFYNHKKHSSVAAHLVNYEILFSTCNLIYVP